jgi:hypothetical protein
MASSGRSDLRSGDGRGRGRRWQFRRVAASETGVRAGVASDTGRWRSPALQEGTHCRTGVRNKTIALSLCAVFAAWLPPQPELAKFLPLV